MLWQKQDAGLLGFFANQITDPAERDRAWQRYHTIRAFVESHDCRHKKICNHFGETPKWQTCGACDVCGSTPEWLKMNCLPDPRKRKKFGDTARVVSDDRVAIIPRCDPDSAPQLPLTAAIPGGAAAYASLANAQAASTPVAIAPPSFEELELREYLREWRRETAREQAVPAYVVLHDTTLDEICRRGPQSIADLLQITGIGERKAEMFGQQVLDALTRFRAGARATPLPPKKTLPAEETLRLLAEGRTFEDIAKIRSRQLTTVVNAVATLVESGQLEFDPTWIDATRQSIIEAACAQVGTEKLKDLKDSLPPEITYDEIRLVVARLRQEQKRSKVTVPA
jgi:ATP-dependent DNA helicase RecQ